MPSGGHSGEMCWRQLPMGAEAACHRGAQGFADRATRGKCVALWRCLGCDMPENPRGCSGLLLASAGSRSGCCVSPVRVLATAHATPAEQEPIERDVFLERELNQEVRVGGRPAFVAVHVLLKDAQVARKLALRPLASDLRQTIGELALATLHGSLRHRRLPVRGSENFGRRILEAPDQIPQAA